MSTNTVEYVRTLTAPSQINGSLHLGLDKFLKRQKGRKIKKTIPESAKLIY
jgi:hypothetical protein